jgi:phage replication O-like protein O
MSGTVHSFRRSDSGQEGRWMESPEGYTQVDNRVQQQLFRVDLNGTQHAIIHAVMQLTWRNQSASEVISAARLAGLMGRDRKVVQRALKVLLDQSILVHLHGRLAVNPDVDQWEFGGKQLVAKEQGKATSERVKRRSEGANRSHPVCDVAGDQSVLQVGTNQSHKKGPIGRQNGDQLVPLNKKEHFEEEPSEKECPGTGPQTTSLEKVQVRHPDAVIAVRTGSGYCFGSADDLALADQMHDRIAAVTLDEKPVTEKTRATWADTIRLMVEQDRRSHGMIWRLFMWANADEFWRTNILSPSSLRKNWGKLAARYNAQRQQQGHTGLPSVQSSAGTAGATLEQILDNDW